MTDTTEAQEIRKGEILSELEEAVMEYGEPDFDRLFKFAQHQFNQAKVKYPPAILHYQEDKGKDDVPNIFKNSYHMLYYTKEFFKVIQHAMDGNMNRLFKLIVYAFEMSKIKHPVYELSNKAYQELELANVKLHEYSKVPQDELKKGRLYVKMIDNVYDVSETPRIYALAYLYKDENKD